MNEVKRTFRPEFINRIDEMIVFHPLNKESLGAILKLLLKDVEKKIQHLHLSLDISEDAQEALISSGTDLEYGARPLRRTIQKEVEDPISELILKGGLQGKSTIHISTDENKKLIFNID